MTTTMRFVQQLANATATENGHQINYGGKHTLVLSKKRRYYNELIMRLNHKAKKIIAEVGGYSPDYIPRRKS